MARTKRERWRELIAEPELLVLPGAYDALSARIAEHVGYSAVTAGGYAAVGSMLAQPDMGQSNMRDYAQHYARIASGIGIPLYVDGDTGFGGVNNVREMVKAFEAAGVAGVFISDQVFPNRCGYLPGKRVIPADEMVAKIKAALDAREDPHFFICARTDVAAIEGVEAALDRCQQYMKAGADMAKPQGLDTAQTIEQAIQNIPGPHFATLSQAAGRAGLGLAELQRLGVAAVTLPSLPLFAAAQAVHKVLTAFKRDGSLDQVNGDIIPLQDYYNIVRLEEFVAREASYLA